MDGCPTGMVPDENHVCHDTPLEDPNAKVCFTAECAAGSPYSQDRPKLDKCVLKCSTLVSLPCKKLYGPTPGPWYVKVAAVAACDLAAEYFCEDMCHLPKPDSPDSCSINKQK